MTDNDIRKYVRGMRGRIEAKFEPFQKFMGEVREKFMGFEKRFEPLEIFTKDFEPFDNSSNEKKFEEVNKGLESIEPFDAEPIMKKIDEVMGSIPEEYNDEALFKALAAIMPYDDTDVKGAVEALEKAFGDFKEYDDAGLKKQISDIKSYDDSNLKEQIAAIMPFDNSDNEKNIEDTTKALLEGIKSVKKSIPAAYDDTVLGETVGNLDAFANELAEKIVEVEKSIPTPYDDTALTEKIVEVEKSIPTPYDDTALTEKIVEVEKSIPTVPEFKEYDDTALIEKIAEVEKSIPEFKEYDDTELQKRVNAMQTLFEKENKAIRETFTKEMAIKDEKIKSLEKRIDIELDFTVTKHFDGDAVKYGATVLHGNSLYVNMVEDNDSVPSSVNKSYKLLIKAPKEPTHKGLYVEGEKYVEGDITMLDNASWWRTNVVEDKGIPSESWKLLAKAVSKRGRKGEKGDTSVADYDEVIQKLHDEMMILKEGV